jgi:GT2 family glycosyltransferase
MMEGSVTAARAPAVVAVVVTRDPGAWFDETLEALAAQDYDNMSVLVLVSGGATDPTARVAAALPDAFVRLLPDDKGFGSAVNEALGMIEGASFFLLCHDDCALAPDALHLMVEEAFRSNAGVVSPKMVHWDDPRALLHVGLNADKTGALVERVQDGEIDAGQHDAVRDVFCAPGGCTLVRADLLRALGGFDPVVTAMGEDLDLSWRAHLAGARVVVSPAARVRHRELVASGNREAVQPDGLRAPSLQALERRHELRAVLVCYSWFHLARVLPQMFALAVAEIGAASVVGDRTRVRAVLHAWRWNFSMRKELRRRHRAVQALRTVSDADVRSLQVRGSARLSTYVVRLTHHGVEAAHGLRPPAPHHAATVDESVWEEPVLTGSVGTAFSEDADFDELDDLGRRSGRDRLGRRRYPGLLATGRSRLVAWLLVVLVLVVGSRGLIGTYFPLLGEYVGFPTWTSAWHQLFATWQSTGLGSGAPASPGFGVLGVLGTVVFGRMGFLQEVTVLGCVPVGAWGLSRLLRPFGSARGRFVGTVAYLGLPLAYDAIARGRWDGLVAFAATPWVLGQLARSTGMPPFGEGPGTGGWRHTLAGRAVTLGVIEAVAISLAPAVAVVVLACGLGVAGGSLFVGGRRAGGRALLVAACATVVAAVLCAPWAVATVLAGRDALSVFGLPGNPASYPGWGGLIRMAVGPIGGSPLAWLLVGAALSPLLLARGERLAWASRLWLVALFGWLLALVAIRAWAVPFAPSVDVLLAPAAVGVAACAGLGVAAFETDLAGYRFGWRQLVAVVSLVAIAAGLLPTLAEAANGRWGLPSVGYAQAVPFPRASPTSSGYRVLWLGDPQALPEGGWSVGPGLACATSVDGTPTLADLWPPASPGPAIALARDVGVAMKGETVDLGRLLARARVRYVVVVSTLAPRTPGLQHGPTFPVPAGLVAALSDQAELRTVPVSVGGLTVFENLAAPGAHAPSATRPAPGTARWLNPLGAALELTAWAVVAAALVGRRVVLDSWWVPLSGRWRRRRRRRRQTTPVSVEVPVPEPDVNGDAAHEPVTTPARRGVPRHARGSV